MIGDIIKAEYSYNKGFYRFDAVISGLGIVALFLFNIADGWIDLSMVAFLLCVPGIQSLPLNSNDKPLGRWINTPYSLYELYQVWFVKFTLPLLISVSIAMLLDFSFDVLSLEDSGRLLSSAIFFAIVRTGLTSVWHLKKSVHRKGPLPWWLTIIYAVVIAVFVFAEFGIMPGILPSFGLSLKLYGPLYFIIIVLVLSMIDFALFSKRKTYIGY